MKKLIPLICLASLFVFVSDYGKAQESGLTWEKTADPKTAAEGNSAEEKIEIGQNDEAAFEAVEWVKKGTEAFNAREFKTAITNYKKAIELDPNSVEAHYNLALSYTNEEMFDSAIAAYKQTIALNPTHAKAYNNLGIAYEKKGMDAESFLMYQKAIEENPALAPAHYNLGRSYLSGKAKGSPDKSQAAYHLHKAGVLFIEQDNKIWASHAYNTLKRTGAKELEQDLYKKLYP